MDNARPAVARFVPDRRFTLAAAAGAVAALVAVFLAADPQSRLIAATAAAVLALYAVGDVVFSPRLTVSSTGLVIRSPFTRATVPWAEVESVHADSRERLGLRSVTLEIDAGATLAVFSRRVLGADPEDAADVIRAFRPVPNP